MAEDAAAPVPDAQLEVYARAMLALNGLVLSPADLALVVDEFRRLQDIAGPLLQHEMPDRLDLAGVFKP
jgi:hypothetical protein